MPTLNINEILSANSHHIVQCLQVFFAVEKHFANIGIHKYSLQAISDHLQEVLVLWYLLKLEHINDKDLSMIASYLYEVNISSDGA